MEKKTNLFAVLFLLAVLFAVWMPGNSQAASYKDSDPATKSHLSLLLLPGIILMKSTGKNTRILPSQTGSLPMLTGKSCKT